MAGIGFELRKMIGEGEGLVSKVRAYVSAGLISSGPWIMTILTLSGLSFVARWLDRRADFEMFRALVTYAFAFSLVVVGVVQMAVTRRVADQLYGGRYDRVLPAFLACSTVVGAVQAVIGALFTWIAGLEPGLAAVTVVLYVIVSLTWLALIWLSVTREHDEVFRAYLYGMAVSLLVLAVVGLDRGAVGLVGAYACGQALTYAMLFRVIVRGMNASGKRDFSVFRAIPEFPQLVGVGLVYNLAIWIDKMVFWFVDGMGPHPWIRFHPLYDTTTFLAYLTVVPALAVNLVLVETTFYEYYRAYYGAILGGQPLSEIVRRRERMFEQMRYGAVRLIRVQGALTALLILVAPGLMRWLDLPEAAIGIFRLACLGAFFHVLLLVTILMQLYFDLRSAALRTCVVFLLLNGGLAIWSVDFGIETYGLGYAAATLVALVVGYGQLSRALRHLDFLTFTGQPIAPATIEHEVAEQAIARAEEEAEAEAASHAATAAR